MSLVDLTAAELLSQMQSGEAGAEVITRAFLDRIDQLDPQIGAFLAVDAEGALAQAHDIDRKRNAGEPLGALAGLPIAVKDVLCTVDQPTTCASRMLESFRPPYDAFVIERLRDADAVLLGKANMDEFAMGSSTENSAFQPTRNPWDPACIPGGSSGGSAAAVAARLAPLAVGSDTGGSIRQPAALCGVVGLKPTYGRVSRFGLVAFASSLDQVGPLAQTASDAALLLEALAGHDPRDATSVDRPVPQYSQQLDRPLDGLRIGVIREHFGEGLDPEVESAVRAALTVYEQNGAALRDVSLPHAKYAVATYYLVAPSEASSNLARYDGVHYGFRAEHFDDLIDMYSTTREEGFGPEVKRRIMLGTYALSAGYYDAYYLKALKVRRLIRDDFTAAFEHADVLAGPTYPTAAFPIGEKSDDPLAMYLGDIYTTSANLAGLPAISVPCGFTQSGLPIGLQLHAPAFAEARLLRAAHAYQQHTDWHTRRPKTATITTKHRH